MTESIWEVIAIWDGYEPEPIEVWPTEREALRSAHIANITRESECVRYEATRKAERDER